MDDGTRPLGRNDPCTCGSGRKYKSCCGRLATAAGPADELAAMTALLHAGRFEELEARAGRALVAWPDMALAWQLRGLAQVGQGKDATQALESAVRCAPEDAAAALNLGNELARRGRAQQAADRYHQALSLQPHFPEAHNNLGLLYLEMGRAADAAEAAGCAVLQRPDYAEGHHTLARALLHSGRALEAAASCRRALALRADFAEAHDTLGSALLRLAQPDAALASFRRALELSPLFAEAHANLGQALRAAGRLDEAVAGLRRALVLKPDLVAAHIDLGTALRLQQRSADAHASIEAALELEPHSSGALVVLAELRADVGRFTDAEELFARATVIDPEAVDAWAGVTRVRRMSAADDEWLVSVQRLAASGIPPRRELVLRYALGKYFDDIDEVDRAFEEYRRANELSAACGPAHDRTRTTLLVDRLIRVLTPEWLAAARTSKNASSRPVFIVGMMRSGTTLAEQIIAAHPGVWGAGELEYWSDRLLITLSEVEVAARIEAGGDCRSRQLVDDLGSEYLQRLTRLSFDAERVVDKMPTNFLSLGLIHAALPAARVIHMHRHPIDTCLSIYFQHLEAANTYANNLGDIAHFYQEYRRLMSHWRRLLPVGCMLEVPYEALVHEPVQWTRAMLEFIGVPWDPKCLEFHASTRTVVTASKWQVRQKIHTGAVQRWRRYEKYVTELKPLADWADP